MTSKQMAWKSIASFFVLGVFACAQSDSPPRDTSVETTTSPMPAAKEDSARATSCEVAPAPDPGSDLSKELNFFDITLPNGQQRDLGIGLLVLRSELSGDIHKGSAGADSIILRQHPDGAAPAVARFVTRSMMIGHVRHICRGLSYTADASLRRRLNLYDSGAKSLAGIPVDSVTPDSVWVRAAYAIDTAFVVHHAWVEARGTAEHVQWPRLLASAGDTAMIAFLDSATRANPNSVLFVTPGGDAASVRLPAGRGEWSMYLNRVEGQWGEVHFRTGDVCGDDGMKLVPGKFWVRLVNDRGRPMIALPNDGIC
jgi:hypothetical protein